MCMCAGLVCTCVCMWRAETDWCPVSSSVALNPILGDRVSYLLTMLVGQGVPRVLLPLPPQPLEYRHVASSFSTVLRTWNQVLLLAWKAFYWLSHFPSPGSIFMPLNSFCVGILCWRFARRQMCTVHVCVCMLTCMNICGKCACVCVYGFTVFGIWLGKGLNWYLECGGGNENKSLNVSEKTNHLIILSFSTVTSYLK